VEYNARPPLPYGIYLSCQTRALGILVTLHSPSLFHDPLNRLFLLGTPTRPAATMRSPPPEVVANWPEPNYVDPVTRGPGLMIVELTLLPIAVIVVCLRLWVRISWLKKSWWDDYLMIAAMVGTECRHGRVALLTHSQIFSIGTTVLVIMATQLYGWDKHVYDLTTSEMQVGRQVRRCTTCVTRSQG